MTSLFASATSRHQAFRPKTSAAYTSMFKLFVAFCIYYQCQLCSVDTKIILSFLECFVHNNGSACMIGNYVSAIKAKFVLYDLPYTVPEPPKIKYFLKAIRTNRLMSIRSTQHVLI